MYRITIETIEPMESERGYPQERNTTIYTQRVETIDIRRVIDAVNPPPIIIREPYLGTPNVDTGSTVTPIHG